MKLPKKSYNLQKAKKTKNKTETENKNKEEFQVTYVDTFFYIFVYSGRSLW